MPIIRLLWKGPRILEVTACTSWDEASGKKGSGKKFCHNLISGADFAAQPYCVAIITPCIRCGMGRSEIDEDSAVLRSGSQAIRGLYAGGEVAGGVHGNSLGMRCLRTRGRSGSCEVHFERQSESDIVCGALRCLSGNVEVSKLAGGSSEDTMNAASNAPVKKQKKASSGYTMKLIAR